MPVAGSPPQQVLQTQTSPIHSRNEILSMETANPMSSNQTPSLLTRVLNTRQIHSADQLFTMSDYDIITELHSAFARIKTIFNDPTYVENTNDQSVVELVLSRLTSAIRETCCIETYAPALVDLLEACLNHRMYVIGSNGQLQDSPHCKIASELLSSLFLYHSKKAVMTVSIPVAIKALNCTNQDLVRNTTSYLSLAAINNGRILSQYSIQIISNITNGNYSLVRVLPQVYPENREPFHAHLSQLFRLLRYTATDTSEKLSLLQLASMVANTKPDLIIPHLPEFEEFLQFPTTCTAVLHIYLSLISMNRVVSLVNQLLPLRRAVRHSSPTQNNLATMGKIIGVIGRTNEHMAMITVPDLIELCHKSNSQNLPILLKEIEGVAEAFPFSVHIHLDTIKEISERQSSTYSAYKRLIGLSGEDRSRSRIMDPSLSGNLNDDVTLIAIRKGFQDSIESLQSKRSSRIFPNDPTPNIVHNDGLTTIFKINENSSWNGDAATEFDRNIKKFVDGIYSKNSTASLQKPSSTFVSDSSLTPTKAKSESANLLDTNPSRASPLILMQQQQQKKVVGTPNTQIRPPPSYPDAIKPKSRQATGHMEPNPYYNPNIILRAPPTTTAQSPQQNRANHPLSTDQINGKILQAQQLSNLTAISSDIQQQQAGAFPPTQIQLGRDGKVRPLTVNQRKRLDPGVNWMQPNLANYPAPSIETTFPVQWERPVTTKVASTSLHGSTIKVAEDMANEKSRVQSTDTLNNRSIRANSWSHTMDRGDVVKQFVDHRRSKIRKYVTNLTTRYPIPLKCTVEGSKGARSRMRIHFGCQTPENPFCIFNNENMFAFKTRIPAVWLHLMFLQVETTSIVTQGKVLSQDTEELKTLAHCWDCLPKDITKNRPFVTLATSAFPAIKEENLMLKELQEARYFDSFSFHATLQKWVCLSCANPDKVRTIINADSNNSPLLEGQLKEKRGRWKFLKRWHTKYFTLSSAALICTEKSLLGTIDDKSVHPSIDLRKIRAVKSLSRGRKTRRSIPKAFEIFTDDDVSYILKATDRTKAEEWFQCLQIAVAQAQRERQAIAL